MKKEIKIFKPVASLPIKGLVLIFDLEGFSKFFAQPDAQQYVPKYLNHVINAIKICIEGGTAYWYDKPRKLTALPEPIHWKFLGDGILIIWKYNDFDATGFQYLFNRLWDLKTTFTSINKKASEDVPVVDIPQRIRFGLCAGTVYKLNYLNSREEEFIGYSINLASRLQSYCRELGFIASARVQISDALLKENEYIKVIATKIKGFPQEIIIVDKNEYKVLDKSLKTELFKEIT